MNLAQKISIDCNVITILLKGGEIKEAYDHVSGYIIEARRGFINKKVIHRALAKIKFDASNSMAIVNSVVSAPILEPLRVEGIPCITLVHEFVNYVKPIEIFDEVGLWSSRVIFSTKLTWNDLVSKCSYLRAIDKEYIPQGKSEVTGVIKRDNKSEVRSSSISNYIDTLEKNDVVILGAGAVQPRKGVDIFIAIAQIIDKNYKDKNIKFAWVGSGYDPENDYNVSIWLKDQIERSKLEDKVTILDAGEKYQDLINQCSIFIVSSRLDPLPNVAIDAMAASKPVLCFDEACGLAELYKEYQPLYVSCVSPYYDIKDMALKVINLLDSPSDMNKISALSKYCSDKWFDMKRYVGKLLDIAEIERDKVQIEDDDFRIIYENNLIDVDYYLPYGKLGYRDHAIVHTVVEKKI